MNESSFLRAVVGARASGSLSRSTTPTYRIAVHDYSGHPFQVELTRELARRGHEVLHLHCPSYQSGKGALQKTTSDPITFQIRGVELGDRFEKYSPWKRMLQEREYAIRLLRELHAFRPNVLISANTPLFSQRLILRSCRRLGIGFIFWQQDIYSIAMKRFAESKLPVVGGKVGDAFVALERSMLRQSDAIVSISGDFEPTLRRWGLSSDKIHVIENWAPLAELPTRSRDNSWAREHGLVDKQVFLYAGTLGIKHNPDLLLELGLDFRGRTDVRIVVVSEGVGADRLKLRVDDLRLTNVVVLGFQPYHALPDVLASGDILVVILESDAGVFSVPSKVLSYLCAGRPLLGALPAGNLAARIIRENGTGIVVDPDDLEDLLGSADQLVSDRDLCGRLGARARAYAEATFDIERIGDRFERIIEDVAKPGTARQGVGKRAAPVIAR